MACFLYVIAFMIVSPYFIYVNIIFYMELLIRTFYIYDTDGWGKFNVDVLFLVLGNFAFVGTNIIRYRETIIRHHFPV